MEFLLGLLILCGVGNLSAQGDSMNRAIDPFTKIKVFDGLQVELIPSKENKVVTSGTHWAKVAVVQKGNLLKLRLPIDKFLGGKGTFVEVYFNSEVRVIDANEESRVVYEDKGKRDRIEIKAQEGGQIYLTGKFTQLVAKAVTGGSLFVEGATEYQDIRISTGGLMQAKDFLADYTTVRVYAGGRAEVHSKDYLGAEVRAGGTIRVYGDPLKMDEKKFIGGTIERVE